MSVQLKKVKYKKVDACFDLIENADMKMQCIFSMTVDYADDNKKCVATLKNNICAPISNDFSINLDIIGYFDCDGVVSDSDKKHAYIEICDSLFPFVQATVADLMVKGGMQPIMLEKAKIDIDSIKI